MARSKSDEPTPKTRRSRPALSTDARENQMVSLAVDLAEQQLRDGSASSQLITHYLKVGSAKERLEREKLIEENNLLRAKAKSIASQERTEELYAKALSAMRRYSGDRSPDDDC